MNRLIPLSQIPCRARAAERKARAQYADRAAALQAARFELVSAPGCHGEPYFAPPRIGWVCSYAAAEALVERLTYMPDGTAHRRLVAYSPDGVSARRLMIA